MKIRFTALAVLLASTFVCAQIPAPDGGLLTRHYRDGETLTYHMTASNDDWHHTAGTGGKGCKFFVLMGLSGCFFT